MTPKRIESRLMSISLLRDRVTSWADYPFNVPVIKNLTRIDLNSQVVFFVGENGSGKSTLLEAIADHCGFGREGGSRNFYRETTESVRSITPLSRALRLSWTTQNRKGFFFRAESFFNNASFLDELQKEDAESLDAYGGKSLHEQSHGESFISLITNRFFRRGLYLLDEPEAALSPQRQLVFLQVLHDLLEGNKAIQFMIATHSPIILAFPDSQILSFDEETVREVQYQETHSYRLFSRFLSSPENYLRKLFPRLFQAGV